MSTNDLIDDLPPVKQQETTVYCFECPGCGDWHEEQSSWAGKIFDCICGTKFKVKK